MKRFFALAALVLGLAACQTEPEGLDVNVGGAVDTTITVTLPDTETRANSAVGAFANLDLKNSDLTIRYILQVYYGETAAPKQFAYSDETHVTFDVRLVPGRDYKFVVWADVVDGKNAVDGVDVGDNHYNTENLTAITFKGDWNAMDETFDAFTGVFDTATKLTDGYTGTSSINIPLTRPFAKLRVLTTDMVELGNLGIVPEGVKVKYTVPVYNSFNALNGAVNNTTVVDKVFEYNLTDDDVEKYEATQTTKTLFTNNLFGAENGVIKFEMSVYDNTTAKELIKFNNFSTDIPVQRNYLTTISGNILTDGNNIKVEVEDEFEKPEITPEAKWDGKTVNEPVKNNNIYEIYTPSELAWVAANVAANNGFAGETFMLMNSIDLGGEAWTPIGNSNNGFKGIFDGQGNTIYNLVVRGGNESDKGLFGATYDGEIKNLVVENANVSGRLNVGVVAGYPYTSKYTDITVQGHVEVNGMAYVGGVGGKNAYADWTNITVNVDETSYVKANSIENGTAYRTYVGGVVGFNGEGGHSFKNITSNINVIGSTCDVGGLFGIAHYGNQFENCTCSGDVAIYAAEEATEAEEIGGIAGVWHNQNDTTVTMTNVEFTGSVTTNITRETEWYNNLVGARYKADGTGKLYLNGYEMVANGVGLKDGAYYVFNADGLRWVAETVNAGNSFANKTINLVNDITLNGEWTPIGNGKHFMGTFDGQGKTISGMTITQHNGSNPKALFGIVSGTVSIKNLTIDGANVAMEDDFDGDFYAAGLIGSYYGTVTIENVTVQNSTFVGNNKVAGLLAHDALCSNLKIDNCHVLNCAISSANYVDGGNVGGMLGLFQGEANGEHKIANSTVKNCTITGINSSNKGKRANAEFVACVSSKAGQTLVIEDCVVENNTFTQTIDSSAAVTYVGPYDNKFVGGERNDYAGETLPGVVIINGVTYDNATPVASWAEFTAAIDADKKNIKLTEDITYDKSYDLKKNVTINLNGKSLEISNPSLMLSIHSNVTIKNGTIKGKVYARKNADITFNSVNFGGTINGGGSTEGLLQVQGACNVYAMNCKFNATNSGDKKSRPLSIEGRSSGTLKFENCEFKSNANQNQVYVNPLSGTATLDFTNCNFNSKTPNIMLAAACPFTNLTMSGTTKLSSVTLEINRAKDVVTESDFAYLREMIANNSFSSVRVFYAGGSSEYIR